MKKSLTICLWSRGPVSLRFGSGSRGCAAAAGGKGKYHCQSKDERDYFFHFVLFPFLLYFMLRFITNLHKQFYVTQA